MVNKSSRAASAQARKTIRVSLPPFLAFAVREIARRKSASVSRLLETWLCDRITIAEVNELASTSEEFRREAEAWILGR